ncbi:hypothetical protein DV735_g2901, partial [Chaetothyriales sp. CBS 134920]
MHIHWAFPLLFPLSTLVVGAPTPDSTTEVTSTEDVSHSDATSPFWQDYTYCQGRTIAPGGGEWAPLKDAQIVKLAVLHRHGARSPALGKLPNDDTEWYQCGKPDEFVFMNKGESLAAARSPFMKEEVIIDGAFASKLWKGNCDIGELTTLGSLQLQELGRTLRTVYVDTLSFLPEKMPSNIGIRHTYIWRTRMSVENLFQGLYPLDTREPDQTLTMNVKPSPIEVMVSPASACPKLANLTAVFSTSAEYNATMAPYTEVQNKLVDAYNASALTAYKPYLYDSASAAFCHGLGLKGDLTEEDIQVAVVPGTSGYHNLWRQNSQAEVVKRLGVGAWLQEILAALADLSSPMQVYSAHDASLDMFLAVVADPDLPWPAFASNVIIEQWQKADGSLVVRMFYEGMIVPAHPNLDCDFSGCPIETLESFLKQYIPTDFTAECKL